MAQQKTSFWNFVPDEYALEIRGGLHKVTPPFPRTFGRFRSFQEMTLFYIHRLELADETDFDPSFGCWDSGEAKEGREGMRQRNRCTRYVEGSQGSTGNKNRLAFPRFGVSHAPVLAHNQLPSSSAIMVPRKPRAECMSSFAGSCGVVLDLLLLDRNSAVSRTRATPGMCCWTDRGRPWKSSEHPWEGLDRASSNKLEPRTTKNPRDLRGPLRQRHDNVPQRRH